MNKKRVLIGALVLALAAWMSAGAGFPPQPASAAAASVPGNYLIVGVDPDYESFDPGRAYEVYAQLVTNAVYNTLVNFEGSLDNLVPDLAESYEVAADATVFTFHLHQNAVFASGNPVTAADVVWSFTRLKNLAENPAFLADGIETIEAVDDHTVVIRLKGPDSAFLSKLTHAAFSVIDSKLASENGATDAADASAKDTAKLWFDSNSAGSGPYVLDSYVPKEQVVLRRNDKYWGQAAAFDRIIIRSIQDPGTQLMMLQKGDIDIAFNLGPENVKQLAGKKDVAIQEAMSLVISFLVMNNDEAVGGPMANPDVRRAVARAIDYEGLQEIAGAGCATPRSIIQLGFLGSLPAVDPAGARNVEEARELMKKAGFENGFKTTMHVPTVAVEGADLLTLAQKVQDDLKGIGIEIEIRPSDVTQAFGVYRDGKVPFGLFYWGPDYPDANNQLAFVAGGSVAGPRARWSEADAPELAALAKQAIAETDNAQRAEYLRKIQETMQDGSPFIVLLQHGRQFAVRSNVKNASYIDHCKLNLRAITKE